MTTLYAHRPVSILCIISKHFERVVHDLGKSYLKSNELLFKFQSGFRCGFSTDTWLIHLTDFIRLETNKGDLVGMILLDLQKAFDTVDHSILLIKLKALGLGDDIMNWFSSYLSDRQQLVDVSGTKSTTANITCGVPQGSILGPLLFLIYVNDMSSATKNKLLLYADDSCILVSGQNKCQIEQALSQDLNEVSQWLIDNKLSLHLGKTESILFGTKHKLRSNPRLNIICNDTVIEPTSAVKYLGASIDQNLSFVNMAQSVVKKSNSRLKFLYRKSEYLTQHTKKLLVMSLIQCHFDYACSVWYNGLTQFWKNKLQVTQNKLIRFVLNLDSRTHISPEHYTSLQWLPVDKRVEQIMLSHVFKIKNGLSPDYLSNQFIPQNSVHSHNTRLSNKGAFSVPHVKGNGKKSFSYLGCTLWNKLPSFITQMTALSSFKSAIKQHLLNRVI